MITDSVSARQNVPSKQSTDPSELSRTISRTEAVRQDVRKLKSVTLDRMGKIFKMRSPAMGRSLDLETVSDLDPRSVMFLKRVSEGARASVIFGNMIYEGSLWILRMSEHSENKLYRIRPWTNLVESNVRLYMCNVLSLYLY